MKSFALIGLALCAGSSVAAAVPYGQGVDLRSAQHVRRPVAAALCDGGRLLVVVNHRSGSVSLIDTELRGVTGEFQIGDRLSDVVALPDDKTLLITDEARHELLIVRPTAHGVEVVDRIATPRTPVNVAVSDAGKHVAVACLWSHRIALPRLEVSDLKTEISDADSDVVDKSSGAGRWNLPVVRLPFAPRLQAFLPGEALRLVVADAFAGTIAVINAETAEIESVRELPAHNIRGMVVSSDDQRLLVSHQVLSQQAQTDFEDVHWGSLMQNLVRDLSVATLLSPHEDLLDGSRRIRLGQTGNAAADPAGIAVLKDLPGAQARPEELPLAVALSGVGELAVRVNGVTQRYSVGARPLDVVVDDSRHRVYVICALDDSIAMFDSHASELATHISLGPQPQATPRDRGERLFYDGHRSHDGWMSCHSCHTEGHTNGGMADTLSDGSYGTPKQIPSLLGTRDANPWAWNGQFRELHAQVSASYSSTLHGEPLGMPQVNDVVAYLHALEPPPPVNEGEWTDDDRRQIDRGRELFGRLGCRACHVPPLTYTIDATFDVGLRDEAELTKFNPPSLRGLSQRRRFLHDGRAVALEDIFATHGHQVTRPLAPEELESLLAFLRSL